MDHLLFTPVVVRGKMPPDPSIRRPTVSDAARDPTSLWRLFQCYDEVDGLAKLSAHQITRAAKTPPAYPHSARVEAIVQRIEETAARDREESGSALLGAAAVCTQKPFDQPTRPKKSPAPLLHAFTRRVRRELHETYHLFLAAFRDAADPSCEQATAPRDSP